jgi:hypothetical protein
MPSIRALGKKCLAAWLDDRLLNRWKKLCHELDMTQTDRLTLLISQDLKQADEKSYRKRQRQAK